MHKIADKIEKSLSIPLLHIADATAKEIRAQNITAIGLLGTQYTMDQDFYKGRLIKKFGLKVLIPPGKDRILIHNIIYDELCLGVIKQKSKNTFRRIIKDLIHNGSEGIILGCTEIMLLVKQEDSRVPVFDTTTIHAQTAVKFALNLE